MPGSQTKEQFLRMLRQKSAASRNHSSLPPARRLQHDPGAHGVAIAFPPGQSKGNDGRQLGKNVFEVSQLRAIAILQQQLRSSVAVEIAQSKGTAVLDRVEPYHSRYV